MLFAVAPRLLGDGDIGEEARSVVHGEQSFVWHHPIPPDLELAVTGTVARVRRRNDVAFTTFDMTVTNETRVVVSGSSLFLMSAGSATGALVEEEEEPDPLAGSQAEVDTGQTTTPPPNRFSASRSDLVRYAGASSDWNPIHWDHRTAVQAGLAGVVVHGLLQSAWIMSVAEESLQAPPASARFRYRTPLRPAVETTVSGTVQDRTCDLRLREGDTLHVAATISSHGSDL